MFKLMEAEARLLFADGESCPSCR